MVDDELRDLFELDEHGEEPTEVPSKARRHPVLRTIATVLALMLIVVGLIVGITVLLWPNQMEEAYGQIQIKIGEWRAEATNEVPSVTLGIAGGMGVLNRCDGTFTEMASYERESVPPVWAAHNNCGGDVILPLKVGGEIDLNHNGSTVRYRIIDVRETPKVWVTTEDLIGLQGDLALQSCFYGGSDVPMKFIGLKRVDS